MSYEITKRTTEIGIRIALGARKGVIHWLVVRQALGPLVAGLLIGAAASIGVQRVIGGLLFGVRVGDPLTTAGVIALITGITLAACHGTGASRDTHRSGAGAPLRLKRTHRHRSPSFPFAAAIRDVLQLHQDVVRIPERQLLGRRVRVGTHPNPRFHAVRRQPFHHVGGIELFDAQAEVIDPAAVLAGGEREELRPLADADDRDDLLLPVGLGALVVLHPHAEHALVERDGALDVGHDDREVIQSAHRDRRRTRKRGRRLVGTAAAERAGTAAVADVLDLHDDVVGIVEFQLGHRRRRVGAHPDVALDAVALEQLDHALRIEAVHTEAEVIDPVAAAQAALALPRTK